MTETMVTVVPRLGLRAPACRLYAATACSSSVRVSARYASTRYVMPVALSLAKFSTFGICMGRSFLVGLCDDSHRTGLDRPAHLSIFPRTPSHAMPCSATAPFTAVGPAQAWQLRNLARPHTRGRAHGQIGGRGLRGFLWVVMGAAVHGCSVFFLSVSEMATDGNARCGLLRRRFS